MIEVLGHAISATLFVMRFDPCLHMNLACTVQAVCADRQLNNSDKAATHEGSVSIDNYIRQHNRLKLTIFDQCPITLWWILQT